MIIIWLFFLTWKDGGIQDCCLFLAGFAQVCRLLYLFCLNKKTIYQGLNKNVGIFTPKFLESWIFF